jgi:hypothetical protein
MYGSLLFGDVGSFFMKGNVTQRWQVFVFLLPQKLPIVLGLNRPWIFTYSLLSFRLKLSACAPIVEKLKYKSPSY